jgi:hypothetical protein
MLKEKLPSALTSDDLRKVLDAIAIVNATITPHLISLNPTERKDLPKIHNGIMPFLKKAMTYAETNPTFLPLYIDASALKADLDAIDKLSEVLKSIEKLYINLADTVILSGSEAYVASLAFYTSVKHAAKMNVPRAKAISDDLSIHFCNPGKPAANGIPHSVIAQSQLQ